MNKLIIYIPKLRNSGEKIVVFSLRIHFTKTHHNVSAVFFHTRQNKEKSFF